MVPRQPENVYRRRRIVVFGALGGLLALAFYLSYTLLAPVRPVPAAAVEQPVPVTAAVTVDYPPYGASAFGAVGFPGVLGSAGSTERLPMASITKVITALVVLQAHPLAVDAEGPLLTFDAVDEQYFVDQLAVDGTRQPVTSGASLSQREVLEVMLMASANNYALSLARWAFGDLDTFAAAAADWLAANGLTSTTVVEPTGLDAGNLSTAAELIELGRLALDDPVVAAIVATPVVDLPGIGVIENRNGLLGVDGVDGIKTGTLDESGANLLFSADLPVPGALDAEPVTVIGVVLGGPDQATVQSAVHSILVTAAAGFVEVELVTAGTEYGSYATVWGESARAVAAGSVSAVLWAGTPVGIQVELDPVALAPIGADVGDLLITAGDRSYRLDLELDGAIEDPGPWWRLLNPAQLG